ncbi:hypothetical protein TTHERM_01164120 (macronuclear) [Tetrahymena thermophila SB210]|uniref:Uncharacterized protein n=1 Tax=Tetrahymena thermophila (strain SB210) TaxID=312017 RepID=Q22AS6_TETTS|nr:hypothetical protein TTHERM_01164120 [Tetrahymena thermophila SB210]EAR82392.1 hypothetical protein TTHERM_01164120 [Tetrahymena thermophila SB210]|eukprot:XP_001030055.1 hypothetical protein TTHERM_01164120 [Tetrahymena thermophila SB210]
MRNSNSTPYAVQVFDTNFFQSRKFEIQQHFQLLSQVEISKKLLTPSFIIIIFFLQQSCNIKYIKNLKLMRQMN